MSKKKIGLKLAVLGDSAVGKTSLINNYVQNHFNENYQPTLGVNILTKDVILNEINVEAHLILWDIAGQDKYELTRQLFFEGCHGSLLVYDISRSSTFNDVQTKWLEDFKNFARPDGIYILIGNKVDLEESRSVSFEEASKLADKINASDFIETSAKYGKNVEDTFKKLAIKAIGKFDDK